MTITYGGQYKNRNMAGNDLFLSAESNSLQDGAGTPLYVHLGTTITTPGVDGITSGDTYTVDVLAWTTVIATIDPRGGMDVIN
jgi:hypothetical protein